MQSLADSIKEHGVIVPILVRPFKHDKFEYEIIAGHNRVQGARIAGVDEIPCNIRVLDNETATILMVDSNLQQRESILPSEKDMVVLNHYKKLQSCVDWHQVIQHAGLQNDPWLIADEITKNHINIILEVEGSDPNQSRKAADKIYE